MTIFDYFSNKYAFLVHQQDDSVYQIYRLETPELVETFCWKYK
jgi:hypothetical protein